MLLANCQILFSGGPHNGFVASFDYLPQKNMVIPADPKWRELPTLRLTRRTTDLAAAYVRVGTRLTDGPMNRMLVWRYRFVSYCTPFVGEQNLSSGKHSHVVIGR